MSDSMTRSVINRDQLPNLFPTHHMQPEFWEQLGRTVGTFGFLEEVLGKAIFALTATREYPDDKLEEAYLQWLPLLERALSDQLWNLAETFGKAAREHPECTLQNLDDLIEDLKQASKIRNVLCHASWRSPDAQGFSIPLFVTKRGEVFETPINIDWLRQVQAHTANLVCTVIDTVTHMGWQFPGGAGPGLIIVKADMQSE